MKPPVETVRITQYSRDILIKLKRKTGIDQWNVLCRWAFCASLANLSKPIATATNLDSNIEMTWKIFAGSLSEIFPVLLVVRARRDNVSLERDALSAYFRSHMERGIGQLQNTKDLSGLLARCADHSI